MKTLRQLSLIIFAGASLNACANASYEDGETSTIFAERWNAGINNNEPPLQMQSYDANTFVIRQSLKTNFEAPFMYLLFGTEKALLIDTGAGGIDLRAFIDAQITAREKENGKPIALTVMHSHAHGDHVAADDQFQDRPNTKVVGKEPEAIAAFFGVGSWPKDIGQYDLGNRTVDIIPTPGHQDSHVMVFDRDTRLLFSGDVIYPGRLYFRCNNVQEYKASIDRVADFAATRNISWVMGAHIELSQTPGKSYNSGDSKRSNERLIELPSSVITQVQAGTNKMLSLPRVEVYDNFTLFPIPENPQGKTPPDWCAN
ncbi:MBL fold metallo-hydrolase [Kordiimonas aquimaris]|uniref:MBL fold metallo-hydrolase n=1 Tax=Kordiimonas aquimaris TaxID=707591 RepID=UPI0021D226A2|nr:MBL fold metallo-hydrolase [Kordiimonas aquimaris]